MKNIVVCAAVIALLPNLANAYACDTCRTKFSSGGTTPAWTSTGTTSGEGLIYTAQGRLPTASSSYIGTCEVSCYADNDAAVYTCGLGYRIVSSGASGYYDHTGNTNTRIYGSKSGIYCYKCPNGSYGSLYGQVRCTLCPAGYMTTGPGQSDCSTYKCSGYDYTAAWETPSWANGAVNTTVENLCKATACKAGAYLSGTKCVACPAGTYNSRSGMTSSSACITCPKATDVWVDSGRTQLAQGTSTAGSTTCWLAPGTYYDKTGQFKITDNNCTY